MRSVSIHNQQVIDYYDATYIDFRVLWMGRSDRAIHFGYYDEYAKNHHTALIRMNEKLAESILINREDIVLDAGCGCGGSAV
ncbi:MAG TPA: hypothetical protein VJH69_00050 [Candidatus Paceibacterota bacterium]